MRSRAKKLNSLWLTVIMCVVSIGCAGQEERKPTYYRDVAPIVFDNCTVCHRDGAAGPFPLVSYDDIADRAQQIVDVTQSRYMPPWLPGYGDHDFVGDRRLSVDEIATLKLWADSGMVTGDVEDAPPKPEFESDWYLGKPDWVGEMKSDYVRQPSDTDTWRNIVLPVDIKQSRYVRAYDFNPGNPQAVHHAVILVDSTGEGRARDKLDTEQGFDGMQNGQLRFSSGSEMPDGQVLGWTPGKIPYEGDQDIAWQINPGDDLIVQLHIPASGKPEAIRCQVALYFSEKKPRKQPFAIALTAREIDIPPGVDDYQKQLEFRLPTEVDLLSLYPHAHYLCEEMLAYAKLPDGTQRTLMKIPEWNFDWQDDYRFAKPVRLPPGTKVGMKYRYNNTALNLRNPNNPPKRVVYGESSTDSMGDLLLQVVATRSDGRQRLAKAYQKYQFEKSLNRYRNLTEREPEQAKHFVGLGEAQMLLEEWKQASMSLQKAIELGNRDPRTYAKLAVTYQQQQDLDEFLAAQKSAVELAPENARFRRDYAVGLQQAGRHNESLVQFQRLLEIEPEDLQALVNVGIGLGRQGNAKQSELHLRRAVELAPNLALAHVNLGITLRAQKKYDEAIRHLKRALELEPNNRQTAAALKTTIRRSN